MASGDIEERASRANRLIADHGDEIHGAATRIYSARREYLTDAFEGYAADTVYSQKHDTYLHWPARDGAHFEGYEELTPGERKIVDDLENSGYTYLGCGTARITLAAPEPFDDLAVKFGRCGPDESFANGRPHILGEWRYSRGHPKARIAPCLHAAPGGEFGIYSRADATLAEEPPSDGDIIRTLKNDLVDEIPDLNIDHLDESQRNVGWLGDEAVFLDYYHAESNSPIGVPAHVDGKAVIEEVDRLRRDGEHMDLGPENEELVAPAIEGNE